MTNWLKSLFKPKKPVAAVAPPTPEQCRAWELSEAEWVREQLVKTPLNRLITIHGMPVQVKMDLAAQGVSNIQELAQSWSTLRISAPYRAKLKTWLDELQRDLHKQYAEFVATKPE